MKEDCIHRAGARTFRARKWMKKKGFLCSFRKIRLGGIVELTKKAEIIQECKIIIDQPDFYSQAFTFASSQRKAIYANDPDNLKRVCAEEYNELSRRLDASHFQESCAVRNVLRTRRLANLLINDKGELNTLVIPKLIVHLKRHLYSLGPDRQFDVKRQLHLLKALTLLNGSKELARLIVMVDRPMSLKNADEIIRDTLQLSTKVSMTDAHARRAVLSAWLCTLRQNVGSCFATAPGIIIHDEQPETFLKDLIALISTGRLKRTFGGVEYSVPLSNSWGIGDLKKPVSLPLGGNFDQGNIWLSPGLEAAFEAAKLLDSEMDLKQKTADIKRFIRQAFDDGSQQDVMLVTAEEIIRRVILNSLKLTSEDLVEYENRHHGMVHSGLLIQLSSSGMGGKGELCASFFTLFNAACNAFKGLADNALLKAWEFTLASFSETKAQFTRWNLYSSLGLGANENGGIGQCIYKITQIKLEETNRRVSDFQIEYEQVYAQLKAMEARVRSVSSEREGKWLNVEYQSKRNEFYSLENLRDRLNSKAQRMSEFYQILIKRYDALFPTYFQEVYDADMHNVVSGPYDDSPAGFCLLYKYGRSNTSQWTYIKTPNEFIESLVAFFTVTENEIATSEDFEGLQTDLSEVVTAIVSHVRTKEFLETAFHRMAIAHQMPVIKDPLEHLDRIEKKPWAYTSGGTMSTLIGCYYKLPDKPTELSRWVESPIELCVFLVDTLKQMPPKVVEKFITNPTKSMLMNSPTHAFLLKPGSPLFREAWTNDTYTYTWVRDGIVNPRQEFVEKQWLDEEMMGFLIQKISQSFPEKYRLQFLQLFATWYGHKQPSTFKTLILEGLGSDPLLRNIVSNIMNSGVIDSTLYTLLPLFPYRLLRERVENLFSAMPLITDKQRDTLMQVFDLASPEVTKIPLIDATTFQNICKGLLCLAFEETTTERDCQAAISLAAQQLEYAMPAPFIFADSNWVKDEFAFVVNPGSGEFELWTVDAIGRSGSPIYSWSQWLNGSRKEPTWSVYNKPHEYDQ